MYTIKRFFTVLKFTLTNISTIYKFMICLNAYNIEKNLNELGCNTSMLENEIIKFFDIFLKDEQQ